MYLCALKWFADIVAYQLYLPEKGWEFDKIIASRAYMNNYLNKMLIKIFAQVLFL